MSLKNTQIVSAAPGMHVDGNGLYLSVTPKGAKSWIFRFQLHGKRREMGLGSLTGLSIWLYDTNHDGLLDKAEHIINGRITPIEPVNGTLPRDYLLDTKPTSQPKIGDAMPVRLFDAIAHDINILSGN